jgi:hypothetical protein
MSDQSSLRRARQTRWYQRHKAEKREQVYAWRRANPEKFAAIIKRYKTRLKKKAAKEAV